MAISISTTTQAIDALLKWKKSQSETQNPQLLPQEDFIYLILTLKKIPQKGGINGARTNAHKIPLPHPLVSPDALPELCLIIDDRPNSKLTSEIAKKKIKADGISVTKVIKLSKLKTDYKPFEAKRKLCDSYDMFFADKRVIPLLPKLLGKQFFKKKKLPLPVDLTHKNWKEQIERGCCSGLLFLRTGTCSVIRVAKTCMERGEIVENVSAAIDGVIDLVPKKFSGVRSLHLKFSESVALPLYQSLPDIKFRIEGIKETPLEIDDMEIEKKKSSSKKVRIHEVNHDMEVEDGAKDEDEGEVIENDDELVGKKRKGEEIDEEKKSGKKKMVEKDLGKKKRKGDLVDVNAKPIDKKSKKKVGKDDVDAKPIDKKSKKKVEKEGVDKKLKKKMEKEGNDDDDDDVNAKPTVRRSMRKVEKEGKDVEAKPIDKQSKKKVGDSGKKKGRSVKV